MSHPAEVRRPPGNLPVRFERRVYRANAALYLGWHGVGLAKAGTYGGTIAAFYGGAQGTVAGLGHAAHGLAFVGNIGAVVEGAITAAVFVRCVRHQFDLVMECERYEPFHRCLLEYCEEERNRRHGVNLDIANQLPRDCGAGYARYQAASDRKRATTGELSTIGVVFARDTLMQGVGAGANMASLWHAAGLSGLLHLGRCAVNATAASLVGGVAGIACGIFHMVGGGLAVVRGKRALQRAKEKSKLLAGRIREHLADAGQVGRAAHAFVRRRTDENWGRSLAYNQMLESVAEDQFAQAIALSRQLFAHAHRSEEHAIETARHQLWLGKMRIGYGAAGTVVGGMALAVALFIGATTPIGWAVAGVGALLSAGWLFYAWRRNKRYARRLQLRDGPPAARAHTEQLVQAALQAVDGQGSLTDPLARKLVKCSLVELGVAPENFRVLKRCRPIDEPHVRAALEARIRQCIGCAHAA